MISQECQELYLVNFRYQKMFQFYIIFIPLDSYKKLSCVNLVKLGQVELII